MICFHQNKAFMQHAPQVQQVSVQGEFPHRSLDVPHIDFLTFHSKGH